MEIFDEKLTLELLPWQLTEIKGVEVKITKTEIDKWKLNRRIEILDETLKLELLLWQITEIKRSTKMIKTEVKIGIK